MILACRQLHKAYGIDVILEKITFHIEEREKAAGGGKWCREDDAFSGF